MVDLHQRPDITNVKNPVDYPWELNSGLCTQKHTFLPTESWPTHVKYNTVSN